jgi:hypothetical protein
MGGLIEYANRLVWKNPDLDLLHKAEDKEYPVLAQVLQRELRLHHARGKLSLPDLRVFGNDAVAVFSDYSGESSGRFYTYTALVCGYSYTGRFIDRMKLVRKAHKLDEKEIEFKDLRMGQLRRALPEYLDALDHLPGFLCTLAVDKRIATLFAHPRNGTRQTLARILETEGLGTWKPDVAEKLLRIVHFTAFLTALLSHDGQKIFWMTDHDAICPTPEAHKSLLSVFDRVLAIYTRPGCRYPLVGGAVPFEPRAIGMLDLLSAADLVAGAIEPCIPARGSKPDGDTRVKSGADKVLVWLACDGIGLKKATIMIRQGENEAVEAGIVELGPLEASPNVPVIPITM